MNDKIKYWAVQLCLMLGVIITMMYLTLWYLDVYTRHKQHIIVPDLSGKTLSEVQETLEREQLRYEVIDSASYNPKIPKYAVVKQNPSAGEQVKQERKIYLTLNPSNYPKVSVPKAEQITLRSATATLKAVGLSVGKITYVDNIAKDMVLKMSYKGRRIKQGDKLFKHTPIDIECGNGNDPKNKKYAVEEEDISF